MQKWKARLCVSLKIGIEGTKLEGNSNRKLVYRISWGFREFENIVLYERNEIVDQQMSLSYGSSPTVPLHDS